MKLTQSHNLMSVYDRNESAARKAFLNMMISEIFRAKSLPM